MSELRRVLGRLPAQLRRRWIQLLPLVVLTAGVEAFAAAAVFGLLGILTQAEGGGGVQARWPLTVLPSRGDSDTLIVAATIAVAAMYVVRLLVLGAITMLKERIAFDSVVELADQLLRAYLTGPFAMVSRRPSSELLLRMDRSTEVSVVLGLSSSVQLTAEVLVVVALVVVLALTAPLTTLIAVLGTAALLFLPAVFTRPIFERYGREEQSIEDLMLHQLRQGIGALREIRVYGRDRVFRADARDHRRALSRVRRRRLVLSDLVRLTIETIFVLVLLLIIFIITGRADGSDVIPLLGLYAYAGFRLVPSANRITLYLNNIRNAVPFMREVLNDLTQFHTLEDDAGEDRAVSLSQRLNVDRLSFRYGPQEPLALSGVTLDVAHGETIGLVGASGAGKSTLADALLGLIAPESGRILADGIDIQAAPRAWRRNIGYVAQGFYLLDESLRRNVAFGVAPDALDDTRVQHALRAACLDKVASALPEGIDTRIGEGGSRLSGGERQRVAIARAIYARPALLVLDEATSALDPATEQQVITNLRSLPARMTTVVIAHRPSTVRHCDRIVMLKAGRVHAVGSFDALMAEPEFRALMAAVAEEEDAQ